MISRKIFILLVLLAVILATTISIIFTKFLSPPKNPVQLENLINSLSQDFENKKTIKDLLNNLKNTNPFVRRDSIIELGQSKNTEAIMPLFSLLMEDKKTALEVDTELVAKALYQVTNGKIVDYAVQLLSLSYKDDQTEKLKDKKTNNNEGYLNINQTINMLYIIMQIKKEDQVKYDFSFLSEILKQKNNDLLLVTLSCISYLGYENLYFQIQNLHSPQSLFTKIPIIKTLMRLALEYDKYQKNTENFLLQQIKQENHPNIQEENYITLYMLQNKLFEIPIDTENLAKRIVGLNSDIFDVAFQQEKALLSQRFQREQISLIKFFLQDFIAPRLKSRLLNILLQLNDVSFLDKVWLKNNLIKRYADTVESTDYLDLAKISLKILAYFIEKPSDLKDILQYIYEKKMSYTITEIINTLMKNKKYQPWIKESLPQIKSIIYTDSSLVTWYAYLLYQLEDQNSLKSFLETQTEKDKMKIIYNLSGCNISKEDRYSLAEFFTNRKNFNHIFDDILNVFVQGNNLCYFV